MRLDLALLQQRLGVPVVGTVAAGGRGVDELKACIAAWYRSAGRGERKVG
jgi:Fe2+ transport system protein B